MLIAPKGLKLQYGLQIWHTCSQGQSGHNTHKFPPKRGVFKNLLGGDMHSHERLLVIKSSLVTQLPRVKVSRLKYPRAIFLQFWGQTMQSKGYMNGQIKFRHEMFYTCLNVRVYSSCYLNWRHLVKLLPLHNPIFIYLHILNSQVKAMNHLLSR